MKKRSKDPARPLDGFVPLKAARMCAECDAVFGKGHAACPRCGSTSWFFLSRFVPSLKGDDDEQAARASYRLDHHTEPEPVLTDQARPFFARAWGRLMAAFRPDVEATA